MRHLWEPCSSLPSCYWPKWPRSYWTLLSIVLSELNRTGTVWMLDLQHQLISSWDPLGCVALIINIVISYQYVYIYVSQNLLLFLCLLPNSFNKERFIKWIGYHGKNLGTTQDNNTNETFAVKSLWQVRCSNLKRFLGKQLEGYRPSTEGNHEREDKSFWFLCSINSFTSLLEEAHFT